MHDTEPIITGGCALNLGDSYDSSSSDLNLIVPHEHFSEMTTYLKEEGSYIDVEKKESPHPSVASANVTGSLRTIVCGNTFADMTFMTGEGVVTLYPDFTLHGKNIRAETTGGPSQNTSIVKMEFTIGTQISISGESSNDLVSSGNFARDVAFCFPSSIVSADEVDIAVQEDNITRHQPSFKTFHSGVLYATGGRTPVLVHVSLKHHISAFRNPTDLETIYWSRTVALRDPAPAACVLSGFQRNILKTSHDGTATGRMKGIQKTRIEQRRGEVIAAHANGAVSTFSLNEDDLLELLIYKGGRRLESELISHLSVLRLLEVEKIHILLHYQWRPSDIDSKGRQQWVQQQAPPLMVAKNRGGVIDSFLEKFGAQKRFYRTATACSQYLLNHHLLAGTHLGNMPRYDTRAGRRPIAVFQGIGKIGGVRTVEKGFSEHEAFVSDHGSNVYAIDSRNGNIAYGYKGLSELFWSAFS
ncbi:hypothetical protein K503DRAFT_817392 [Rhizopogon vinicolor AM-OR11-026]|uniref:Uncharacterized protein n=1 Tax=Rhizopogon vinicolor AM-OR11-026 TaxID=1314800 RepID=A0A1B7N0T7_9AGAM|nr:hypothetical protein K503DRAFT_817392 [Rhizopogon vinicolor AM-OR11-026]